MNPDALPLRGRTALVTGVSRRRGIGFAVARQLACLGADLFVHHYRPHDLELPWGADDLDAVRTELVQALRPGARFADLSVDLAQTGTAERLVTAASGLTGHLDILVANHAKSGDDGSILDMSASRLDAFWQTNTRSTLLLTTAFARLLTGGLVAPACHPGERLASTGPFPGPRGRVFWMTSGQIHGPMRGEVAYAASKAALAGVTATVAAELLDLGIVLNTIDPGPVNTGYLDPETTDRPLEASQELLATTAFGRSGRPQDVAELIGWLVHRAWVLDRRAGPHQRRRPGPGALVQRGGPGTST